MKEKVEFSQSNGISDASELDFILEQIDAAIALFSPTQHLIHFNQRLTALWCLLPQWLQEKPSLDDLAQEVIAQGYWTEDHRQALQEAVALGQKAVLPLLQLNSIYLEMTITPTPNAGVLIICRCQTPLAPLPPPEQTWTDTRADILQQVEELHYILVRHFTNGMVALFEPKLHFLMVGGQGLACHGLSREEMEGRTPNQVFPSEICETLTANCQAAFQGTSRSCELALGDRIYRFSTHPIKNRTNQIFAGILVGENITGRKQLEALLRQANIELGNKVEQQIAELRKTANQLRHEINTRQEIQQALKISEERYRSVVSTLSEGIILQDQTGKILTCNASAAAILGIPIEAMIGQRCGELPCQFISEGGVPLPLEAFPCYETLQTGKACFNVVVGVYRSATELRWLSINSQPLFQDAQPIPYAVVSSFSDITEQKQVESQLLESEKLFRQLTDHIPQVFWIADPKTREVIFVSPAFEQIWGYSCESLYATPHLWQSCIYSDDRLLIQNRVEEMKQDNHTWTQEIEYRIMRSDGSTRWIRDRAFPIYNEAGQIYRVAGVAEDITQRKKQEKQLRLLESVVVHASDAIIVTESYPIHPPGPRILYVNEAFTRLTGYSPEEVVGKTPRILQGPNTNPETLAKIRHALENWEPILVELQNYHKDGFPVWVELSIFPVTDEAGQHTHWIAIQRDITQRKQIEEEYLKNLQKERQLNELKTHFVSNTSHEFRTPLSIILSASELLEHYGHTWSLDEQQEQLRLIQSTVKHMIHLLEDILLIGRAESGNMRFYPLPLDGIAFCRKFLKEVRPEIEKTHQLQFEVLILDDSAESAIAHIDEKLVRQILTNLLSNAVKYSPRGSTVTLRFTLAVEFVQFQIIDQGIGIPEADQPYLFEFFRRASNVGTVGGTGLGLAITKHCVQTHQGQIEFTSQQSVGTTFTVTLPRMN